jgi:hypothetical protein
VRESTGMRILFRLQEGFAAAFPQELFSQRTIPEGAAQNTGIAPQPGCDARRRGAGALGDRTLNGEGVIA